VAGWHRGGGSGSGSSGDPGGPGGDGLLRQELVAGKAAVARPAFRVEQPEGGPPVRRPMAVLRDADLGPLADNLPAEADPVGPPELEPDAGSLGEGGPNG
jgi:hypothetical protein